MSYYNYRLRIQVPPEGVETSTLKYLRSREHDPYLPERTRVIRALQAFWGPEAVQAAGEVDLTESAEDSIVMLAQRIQEIAALSGIDLDTLDLSEGIQRVAELFSAQSKRAARSTRRQERKKPGEPETQPGQRMGSPVKPVVAGDIETAPSPAPTPAPTAQNGEGRKHRRMFN